MFDYVLDSKEKIINKEKMRSDINEKSLNMGQFEDLWHHLKEEATQKDDQCRYMFKNLWLREAWLQSQYLGL
jgi:hypothetical protein